MSDYFSATAGAYIAALSAWALLGVAYLGGGPIAWAAACVVTFGSVVLALRAFRDGEAGIPTVAAPICSTVALLYVAVPSDVLFVILLGFVAWLSVGIPGRAPRIPISATMGAYILGGCAWILVGVFFLMTSPDEEASHGCDLIDCFGGLGDEIFWYVTLAPAFFVLSLAGVGVAARVLWRYGWSTAAFGALALSGSGPAIYAMLAFSYG